MPDRQEGAVVVAPGLDEMLRGDLRLCPLDPSSSSGVSRSTVEL